MINPDDFAKKMQADRADSNWKNHPDVHWGDLEFYLEKARRNKDYDSFNTAIQILKAIQNQLQR